MSNKRKKKYRPNHHSKVIEQSWTEVDAIYTSIAESIVEIAIGAQQHVEVLSANGYEHNAEAIIATSGLNRDLDQITNDLKSIQARHADRSGTIKPDDDYALACSVFTDYHTLSNRMQAVVFQPMLTLTEFMTEIATRTPEATQ